MSIKQHQYQAVGKPQNRYAVERDEDEQVVLEPSVRATALNSVMLTSIEDQRSTEKFNQRKLSTQKASAVQLMNAASNDFTKSLKTPSALRNPLQLSGGKNENMLRYEVIELLTVFGINLDTDVQEGVSCQPQVLYHFNSDSFGRSGGEKNTSDLPSYVVGLKDLASPRQAASGKELRHELFIIERVECERSEHLTRDSIQLRKPSISTSLATNMHLDRFFIASMDYDKLFVRNGILFKVRETMQVAAKGSFPIFGTLQSILLAIHDLIVVSQQEQALQEFIGEPQSDHLTGARSTESMLRTRLEFAAAFFFKYLYVAEDLPNVMFKLPENTSGRTPTFTLRNYYRHDRAHMHIDDFSFSALVGKAANLEHVLQLVRAVLLEKKIIFIKSDMSNMAEIIQTLLSLTLPFKWNFPIISNLPASRIETLECPQAFIIGIQRQLWDTECSVQRMDNRGEEGYLIYDLDTGESRGLLVNYDDPADDDRADVQLPTKAVDTMIKNCRWMFGLKKELIDRITKGKVLDRAGDQSQLSESTEVFRTLNVINSQDRVSPHPSPYADEMSNNAYSRHGAINQLRSVDGADGSALKDFASSAHDEKASDGASFRPQPPVVDTQRGRGTKAYSPEQAEQLYWVYLQLSMKKAMQLLFLRILGNLLHGFRPEEELREKEDKVGIEKMTSNHVFDLQKYLKCVQEEMPDNAPFVEAFSQRQSFHVLIETLYHFRRSREDPTKNTMFKQPISDNSILDLHSVRAFHGSLEGLNAMRKDDTTNVKYADSALRALRRQEHKKIDEIYMEYKRVVPFKFSYFVDDYMKVLQPELEKEHFQLPAPQSMFLPIVPQLDARKVRSILEVIKKRNPYRSHDSKDDASQYRNRTGSRQQPVLFASDYTQEVRVDDLPFNRGGLVSNIAVSRLRNNQTACSTAPKIQTVFTKRQGSCADVPQVYTQLGRGTTTGFVATSVGGNSGYGSVDKGIHLGRLITHDGQHFRKARESIQASDVSANHIMHMQQPRQSLNSSRQLQLANTLHGTSLMQNSTSCQEFPVINGRITSRNHAVNFLSSEQENALTAGDQRNWVEQESPVMKHRGKNSKFTMPSLTVMASYDYHHGSLKQTKSQKYTSLRSTRAEQYDNFLRSNELPAHMCVTPEDAQNVCLLEESSQQSVELEMKKRQAPSDKFGNQTVGQRTLKMSKTLGGLTGATKTKHGPTLISPKKQAQHLQAPFVSRSNDFSGSGKGRAVKLAPCDKRGSLPVNEYQAASGSKSKTSFLKNTAEKQRASRLVNDKGSPLQKTAFDKRKTVADLVQTQATQSKSARDSLPAPRLQQSRLSAQHVTQRNLKPPYNPLSSPKPHQKLTGKATTAFKLKATTTSLTVNAAGGSSGSVGAQNDAVLRENRTSSQQVNKMMTQYVKNGHPTQHQSESFMQYRGQFHATTMNQSMSEIDLNQTGTRHVASTMATTQGAPMVRNDGRYSAQQPSKAFFKEAQRQAGIQSQQSELISSKLIVKRTKYNVPKQSQNDDLRVPQEPNAQKSRLMHKQLTPSLQKLKPAGSSSAIQVRLAIRPTGVRGADGNVLLSSSQSPEVPAEQVRPASSAVAGTHSQLLHEPHKLNGNGRKAAKTLRDQDAIASLMPPADQSPPRHLLTKSQDSPFKTTDQSQRREVRDQYYPLQELADSNSPSKLERSIKRQQAADEFRMSQESDTQRILATRNRLSQASSPGDPQARLLAHKTVKQISFNLPKKNSQVTPQQQPEISTLTISSQLCSKQTSQRVSAANPAQGLTSRHNDLIQSNLVSSTTQSRCQGANGGAVTSNQVSARGHPDPLITTYQTGASDQLNEGPIVMDVSMRVKQLGLNSARLAGPGARKRESRRYENASAAFGGSAIVESRQSKLSDASGTSPQKKHVPSYLHAFNKMMSKVSDEVECLDELKSNRKSLPAMSHRDVGLHRQETVTSGHKRHSAFHSPRELRVEQLGSQLSKDQNGVTDNYYTFKQTGKPQLAFRPDLFDAAIKQQRLQHQEEDVIETKRGAHQPLMSAQHVLRVKGNDTTQYREADEDIEEPAVDELQFPQRYDSSGTMKQTQQEFFSKERSHPSGSSPTKHFMLESGDRASDDVGSSPTHAGHATLASKFDTNLRSGKQRMNFNDARQYVQQNELRRNQVHDQNGPPLTMDRLKQANSFSQRKKLQTSGVTMSALGDDHQKSMMHASKSTSLFQRVRRTTAEKSMNKAASNPSIYKTQQAAKGNGRPQDVSENTDASFSGFGTVARSGTGVIDNSRIDEPERPSQKLRKAIPRKVQRMNMATVRHEAEGHHQRFLFGTNVHQKEATTPTALKQTNRSRHLETTRLHMKPMNEVPKRPLGLPYNEEYHLSTVVGGDDTTVIPRTSEVAGTLFNQLDKEYVSSPDLKSRFAHGRKLSKHEEDVTMSPKSASPDAHQRGTANRDQHELIGSECSSEMDQVHLPLDDISKSQLPQRALFAAGQLGAMQHHSTQADVSNRLLTSQRAIDIPVATQGQEQLRGNPYTLQAAPYYTGSNTSQPVRMDATLSHKKSKSIFNSSSLVNMPHQNVDQDGNQLIPLQLQHQMVSVEFAADLQQAKTPGSGLVYLQQDDPSSVHSGVGVEAQRNSVDVRRAADAQQFNQQQKNQRPTQMMQLLVGDRDNEPSTPKSPRSDQKWKSSSKSGNGTGTRSQQSANLEHGGPVLIHDELSVFEGTKIMQQQLKNKLIELEKINNLKRAAKDTASGRRSRMARKQENASDIA